MEGGEEPETSVLAISGQPEVCEVYASLDGRGGYLLVTGDYVVNGNFRVVKRSRHAISMDRKSEIVAHRVGTIETRFAEGYNETIGRFVNATVARFAANPDDAPLFGWFSEKQAMAEGFSIYAGDLVKRVNVTIAAPTFRPDEVGVDWDDLAFVGPIGARLEFFDAADYRTIVRYRGKL
jgi:hypothetical protein